MTRYLGRVTAIGRTPSGAPATLYRISSRSFPDRSAFLMKAGAVVAPRAGAEGDLQRSSFIAYDCLRVAGERSVVSNGNHTGIIADKLAAGDSPRHALMTVLALMDYEHDDVGTPRIAGIVEARVDEGYLGVVTPRALHVAPVALIPGALSCLATSAEDPTKVFMDAGFDVETAAEACRHILGRGDWASASHPVTAAAAIWRDGRWDVATLDHQG